MINIENVLRDHGIGVGISKQKYLDMERRAINGEAIADITDRTTGASGFFYDLFDNTNDHSCGVMDTRKTTANQALTAGTTILTDKVVDATGGDLVNGFITGSELTIQDDEFKEYVTVTTGGISEDSVTYDRSTPTTVVSSAYTTSKDARPQVLSNGWIVTADINGTTDYRLRVSKDNGGTWLLLAVGGGLGSISMVSRGTIIYLIRTQNAGTSNYLHILDVATFTLGNTVPGGTVLDSSQTSFSAGCSITINEAGTELHATWSSKNATYPNSFNIRYAKGTISAVDGSVTWGSVEQVTIRNTTGQDMINPCIFIQDSTPLIVSTNNTNAITIFKKAGLTSYPSIFNWTYQHVYDGGSYAQSSPDLISDQNGILWVAWHGLDATDTTYNNVHCKYSTDGGITWIDSGVSGNKITSGNLYNQAWPSITLDKNNNPYILWYGTDATTIYSNIYKISRISGTWGSIIKLTTNTTANAQYPSTCSNFQDFTDPLCIYKDNQAVAVKFRGIFSVTTQTPHLEVTPLQNSYKTNVWCYRSLGNVDTVNGRLGFSQGFDTGGGVYVPLLSEDIRYIITPSSPVSQVVSWTDYDLDGNFSIDTKISLVNTSSPESFGTATKKTTLISEGINEDQNVYIAPSNSRITQRITISRASTSVTTKYVKKLLGAVG